VRAFIGDGAHFVPESDEDDLYAIDVHDDRAPLPQVA
jgi:hypothetical protein